MSDQAKSPADTDLIGHSFALDQVVVTLDAATCNLDLIANAIEQCPEEAAGCTAVQWAGAIRLVTQALDSASDFAAEWKKPGVMTRKRPVGPLRPPRS